MATAIDTAVARVLQEKLSGLAPAAFALVTVPAEEVMSANVAAVKIMEAKGFSGVYVSLSKDYLTVAAMLGAAGVDVGRIRFVDAISRMYGIAPVESAEVVYVDGPLSVRAIIDGIAESVRAIKGEGRFVLLDSLTSVLLYNSVDATVEFGKSLRTLLKKEGATGLVVVSYRDAVDEDLLKKLKKGGGEVVAAAS